MTPEEILEQLKQVLIILKPKTDLSAVSMNSRLVTDLGVDSLSQMLLAMAIEDKFGITIDSAVNFQKVSDVVNYVSDKMGK